MHMVLPQTLPEPGSCLHIFTFFTAQCCSGYTCIACSNAIKPPNQSGDWLSLEEEGWWKSGVFIVLYCSWAMQLLQGFLTRSNPRDILQMPCNFVHPYCCITWHVRSIMSFNACLIAQPHPQKVRKIESWQIFHSIMLTMRHKSSLQHPSQYVRMSFTTGVKKYVQNYQRWHFILSFRQALEIQM